MVDGSVEQRKTVSAGSQNPVEISFTIRKTKPGTYQVAIGAAEGEFTVIDKTGSPPNFEDLGTVDPLTFILISFVIIELVAVALLARRT